MLLALNMENRIMKKIGLILGMFACCFSLTSCSGPKWLSWLPWVEYNESEKSDFEVSADFNFYKDEGKKEKFSSNEFEINTHIFVAVDFSITKNAAAEEETISFVVQIPYAEYYSTKDFYSGTIKPNENEYTQQDQYGNEYTVKELNQMNFIIADKETHKYTYIFEIEAVQVCESADFIVRFKPENTNLSVAVNGQKGENKAKTAYSFKAKESN